MSKIDTLRHLADQIENQPQAREQIAAGFRLMAGFFEHMLTLLAGSATPEDALRVLEESAHQLRESIASCTDCTSQQGQSLDPDDNPEAGADTAPRKLTAEESNAIGQAMAAAQTEPAGADLVDTATGPGLEG